MDTAISIGFGLILNGITLASLILNFIFARQIKQLTGQLHR